MRAPAAPGWLLVGSDLEMCMRGLLGNFILHIESQYQSCRMSLDLQGLVTVRFKVMLISKTHTARQISLLRSFHSLHNL